MAGVALVSPVGFLLLLGPHPPMWDGGRHLSTDPRVEGTSAPFLPITAVQIKLMSPGLWNASCQCWLWKDALPLPASPPTPPPAPEQPWGQMLSKLKWGRLVRECLVSTPKVGSRKRAGVLISSFPHPSPVSDSGPRPYIHWNDWPNEGEPQTIVCDWASHCTPEPKACSPRPIKQGIPVVGSVLV